MPAHLFIVYQLVARAHKQLIFLFFHFYFAYILHVSHQRRFSQKFRLTSYTTQISSAFPVFVIAQISAPCKWSTTITHKSSFVAVDRLFAALKVLDNFKVCAVLCDVRIKCVCRNHFRFAFGRCGSYEPSNSYWLLIGFGLNENNVAVVT